MKIRYENPGIIGKDRVLIVGESNDVDCSDRISLLCRNCNTVTYDIAMTCVYKLENEDEVLSLLMNAFPSPLYVHEPEITNQKRLYCPFCKSIHQFTQIPRVFKGIAQRISIKGYRIVNVSIPRPSGTDWASMSVWFEPISQYAKNKAIRGVDEYISVQQVAEYTIVSLSMKKLNTVYGDKLIIPMKVGQGSSEKVYYQVDNINNFPNGTYERWYEIFIHSIQTFTSNLPVNKIRDLEKNEVAATIVMDDDPFVVPSSGKAIDFINKGGQKLGKN